MRVLHVVGMIAPDGRFGGPARVATDQARWLREHGHRVTVAAAAQGFDGPLPTTYDGVPVTLFAARRAVPGIGFPGLVAPGMPEWLRRAADGYDVAHVHLGRDLVTMRAARALAGRLPLVLQTHGMIMPTRHPAAPLFDHAWTRPALGSAAEILTLTEAESEHLRRMSGGARVTVFANATAVTAAARPPEAGPDGYEVLFLARLARRKNPVMFAEAARLLLRDGRPGRFSLVGPDEGELDAVHHLIRTVGDHRLTYAGTVEPPDVSRRMARAAVYVLPAVDEPFGLTVLEALAACRPVVVTTGCALAPLVREADCGLVVEPTVEALAAGIARLLERSPQELFRLGRNGRDLVEARFSPGGLVERLGRVYAGAARAGERGMAKALRP